MVLSHRACSYVTRMGERQETADGSPAKNPNGITVLNGVVKRKQEGNRKRDWKDGDISLAMSHRVCRYDQSISDRKTGVKTRKARYAWCY